MKNIVKIGFAALLPLVVSSCMINRGEEKVRSISVSGTASVVVPSDICEIEFVVTTAGWSAKQIVQDNDVITGRFLNAVKEVGVPDGDVARSECLVSNPGSYEARRTVTVRARNLALVPAIIDCKTGLIRLKSVDFQAVDMASEVRSARSKAVQNAQDAAGLLAGASGCKLGGVVSIYGDEILTEKTSDNNVKITANVAISYDLL